MTLKARVHGLADNLVRRFPGTRLPTRWNGAWLTVPRASWESIHRTYEPYLAAVLRTFLQPGGCFIDVGAHLGWWSLFAATRVGSAGRVLALEPSVAYDLLAANAAPYPQITALRVGAGATDGAATFFGQGVSSSGSFVEAVTAINQHYQTEIPIAPLSVPICTLDGLVAKHHLQAPLVKIDVEGFEAQVLDGATGLLASGVPCVIEIHPPQLTLSGDSAEAVQARLMAHGYTVQVLDRNPNGLYTVLASRAHA
ncbi:MAG: FkbM family methyltransferase [bacterium]